MILSFRDSAEKCFYSVTSPPTCSTDSTSLLSNLEMSQIFVLKHYLHILIRYQKMHSDCTVVHRIFFTSRIYTFRSAEVFFVITQFFFKEYNY